MTNTLNYFMWGYQPHFRVLLEHRARDVLADLGAALEPRAILVGIRLPDVVDGHPVCVEPEDGVWEPSLFLGCHERAEALFAGHPDHAIYYGDEPRMRDKPEMIRRKSVRQAVVEIFDTYDTANGTLTFCGSPVRVGKYHVVPALQVSRDRHDAFPHLEHRIVFRDWKSATGIVEKVLLSVLVEASDALGTDEPGRFDTFRADRISLLRQAARGLCDAVTLALRDIMLQGIFDTLNDISSLRYEGGGASGEIVFAASGSPSVDHRLSLLAPVPLSSHRLARKLVETSGRDLACICGGARGISALGTVRSDSTEMLFRVVFRGYYRWDLYANETLLMECAYGVPRLRSVRLSEALFKSNVVRLFPGLDSAQCAALWSNVAAAMEQGHGTMLVVSDGAGDEAHRLRRQSLPITPMALTPELVRRVSGIDGAILVDRDARCFAIGVILDGLASEEGDASRGARYNSALRYVGSVSVPTVCLVVSEDGQVSMVPTLRAQISRKDLRWHIERLATLTGDNYHASRSWLDAHRFYLTQEECDIVNREFARIERHSPGVGRVFIDTAPFDPHEEMNDSYYESESIDAAVEQEATQEPVVTGTS